MPKYRYVRNKEANDYTNSVQLEKDSSGQVTKSIGVGGVTDLTNEQYLRLSKFAVLELVKEPAKDENKFNNVKNDDK